MQRFSTLCYTQHRLQISFASVTETIQDCRQRFENGVNATADRDDVDHDDQLTHIAKGGYDMAIVKSGVASNGARWRIHDDAYAGQPPEELERRRKAACEVAYSILVSVAQNNAAIPQDEEQE